MPVNVVMSGTGMRHTTHVIERVAMNARNAKPAMEGVAQIATDAIRDQFRTQGNHFGSGWEKLSPGYRKHKTQARPGRPMLVYDGTLKKTIAPVLSRNSGFYQVSGKRMEVGMLDAQVPYAKYHQNGTRYMPRREIVGSLTREDQKKMTKVVHQHLFRGGL